MKIDTKNLKAQFEENPTAVLAVVGMAAAGIANLIKAGVSVRNSRTWAKEVNRRTKMYRR